MTQVFIVDLDQTLIDTPPPPSVSYDKVDWIAVNEANRKSPPIKPILDFVNDIGSNGKYPSYIIFMTGRESSTTTKQNTEDWLKEHVTHSNYEVLYRTPGDFRIDHEIKYDLTKELLKTRKLNIVAVLDDKQSNCDMFAKSFGFKAIRIDKDCLPEKFFLSSFGNISSSGSK